MLTAKISRRELLWQLRNGGRHCDASKEERKCSMGVTCAGLTITLGELIYKLDKKMAGEKEEEEDERE